MKRADVFIVQLYLDTRSSKTEIFENRVPLGLTIDPALAYVMLYSLWISQAVYNSFDWE